MVGLEAFAYKLPALVSTGQQQLAAIARALACDPPLLVADEPTGNLDSKSAAAIIDLFTGLSERGKTIVMVTHDPSLTARTTRNIILSDGELIDEAVSRALPYLKHRFMLEITKTAGRSTHPAGSVILKPGQPVDHLFVVAHGSVEVLRDGAAGRPVARIGAGGHFGEIELLRGGKASAAIRAGSRPVELLTVPRADFLRMLEGSKLMAEAMEKIVRYRLEERRTRDDGTGARGAR
jgi:energy-coupling factor transporter ATP-binding protein EcfA2